MSLTLFLGLCILGLDFMIYVLFQWTYGDRRNQMARKLAAYRSSMKEQAPRPFVVRSENGAVRAQEPGRGESMTKESHGRGVYKERLA
jgi:hypothetical protein